MTVARNSSEGADDVSQKPPCISRSDTVVPDVDLQTDKGEISSKTQGTSYFSLPAELRCQIMEYVLEPGVVRIPPAPLHRLARSSLIDVVRAIFAFLLQKALWLYIGWPEKLEDVAKKHEIIAQAAIERPEGVQMLATCRQMYEEGHHRFWSTNSFCLPPGPIENTTAWLSRVQIQHQQMMKTIVVTLALEDIPLAVLQDLYYEAKSRQSFWRFLSPAVSEDQIKTLFEIGLIAALSQVWPEKLRFLLRWGYAAKVCDSVYGTDLRVKRPIPEHPGMTSAILRVAYNRARDRLSRQMNRTGWEATAAWLAKKGVGTEEGLEVTFIKDTRKNRGRMELVGISGMTKNNSDGAWGRKYAENMRRHSI